MNREKEQVRNRIERIAEPVGPYRVYVPPLGARQPTPPAPSGEGGYLDDCIGSEISPQKKRKAERLAKTLAPPWRAVLASVGLDAFMATAEALHRTVRASDHQRRVRLPTKNTLAGGE